MEIHAILPVNKPKDFTSFDVIGKLRGVLKTKKIGHSGTLDPMATGVLPLFIGNATKAIALMANHPKRYVATCKLGFKTDTLDSTGEVLEIRDPNRVTQRDIQKILPQFTGRITQVPPMYSAVKQNGKKLYQLARKGIEVERKERLVTVFDIQLRTFDEDKKEFVIDVKCSKGTYIRTLIDDIGETLGCGAMMTDLVRQESDGFLLENCYTIEQIEQAVKSGTLENLLLDISAVLNHYDTIVFTEKQVKLFCNGVILNANRVPAFQTEFAVVKNRGGQLIGVCYKNQKDEIRVKTMFQRG